MPVPAIDADKRGDAYKKVKPVEGIDEQGLVPDPQVMHVLFDEHILIQPASAPALAMEIGSCR